MAVGLIVMAGAVGFAVGHVTGGDDGRLNLSNAGRELRVPMPGGEGQGQGQPGQDGFGGRGHQDGDSDGFMGHDDDGDGFMGGDGMMPQDGTTPPTAPSSHRARNDPARPLVQQVRGGGGDPVDRLLEGGRVVRRGRSEPADLADVLKGGGPDVVVPRLLDVRWAQCLDASAHAPTVGRPSRP